MPLDSRSRTLRVNLKVPIGDGVVPAQVTTDESGIAMFMYRAGPSPGPILISAQSGQMTNAIQMDQVEEGRVVQRERGDRKHRKSTVERALARSHSKHLCGSGY